MIRSATFNFQHRNQTITEIKITHSQRLQLYQKLICMRNMCGGEPFHALSDCCNFLAFSSVSNHLAELKTITTRTSVAEVKFLGMKQPVLTFSGQLWSSVNVSVSACTYVWSTFNAIIMSSFLFACLFLRIIRKSFNDILDVLAERNKLNWRSNLYQCFYENPMQFKLCMMFSVIHKRSSFLGCLGLENGAKIERHAKTCL